jgi:glycosyltransferase involved in cell wall biosynthesis
MENKKIKVSVVIPVYNTEKYVREAVESIMNQTLRELEIIIINDGSTDNSLQVVEELAGRQSDTGVFANQPRIVNGTQCRHHACPRKIHLFHG